MPQEFTDDDAQDYLNDFAREIAAIIREVDGDHDKGAGQLGELIAEHYEFRDLLANLWEDANYSGYWRGRIEENPSELNLIADVEAFQENPFHNECCPRTKGGGHKFRCPEHGVQQMVVPVNVTESNEGEVSELWRTRIFDRPVDAEESQD